MPVKIKNRVCESDDDREKRQAQEEEERQTQQKKLAEEDEARQKAAAAKLSQTCKEWEQKHPLGGPVDVLHGKADNGTDVEGLRIGSPEGCIGPLETAYNEKMPPPTAAPDIFDQLAANGNNPNPQPLKPDIKVASHWATIANDRTEIYKRCYFNAVGNVSPVESCQFANTSVAAVHKGDRVQVLSKKIRTPGADEIYEVRFQSWTGWVSATDLTLETGQ